MLLNKIIRFVVKKRNFIEKFFVLILILSTLCIPFVNVNYDLTEYLPQRAASKQGLNVMEDEFGYPGTARVMIGPVSLYEAKIYKDKIAKVDNVDMVLWLDSMVDVYQSNLFIDYKDIDEYYKDDYAIMDITFVDGDTDSTTSKAIDDIKKILGDKGYLGGSAVENKSLTENLQREVMIAMVMAVFMIAIILCITTTSWFEPILFLMVMGVAILINMGTNIFIGTISFITQSVSSLLLLACAMDYSVFLLHSFTAEVESGVDEETAISNAIKKAVLSIVSSGATTIVGFIVLTMMEFSIGFDLGIVLSKGIVIALLTVLIFMPALILRYYKTVEKFRHRPFVPSFKLFGKFVYKVRFLMLIIALFVSVPAYTAQKMNKFLYGNSSMGASPGTEVYSDEQKMNEMFGRSNLLLLLVPNTSMITEGHLTDELENLNYVKSVTSLAGTLPEGIPDSFLPESLISNLHTKNYSRILCMIKTDSESKLAFDSTIEITDIMHKYYPENSHIVGVTPSTADIRDIITVDYNKVNILSLIGVAIVVAITFKSLIIPIIVMIPIELAIFINMAIPYIVDNEITYIGYIVVSCIQLGATIDYSILVTNNYLNAREEVNKKEAAISTVEKSTLSILTSGSILTIVGYGLYYVSSVGAIADLGRLVGRGAFFSIILVIGLLPILLIIGDKAIFNQKRRLDKLIQKRRHHTGKVNLNKFENRGNKCEKL